MAYEKEFAHRRESTVHANNEAVGSFLRTVGLHDGMYIGQITRDTAQEFRHALLEQTTIKRIGGRPLKPVTMAKRLWIIKAFTKWCFQNAFLTSDPFAGIQINSHQVTAIKLRKEAWSVEEIATILAEVWPRRLSPDPREREWTWYLLSLVDSGCRASEILNCDFADVKQDGASWTWDIFTAPDKLVKNIFSVRKVPIPATILKAGYMDYVRTQPAEGKLFTRLFKFGIGAVSLKFARLTKSLSINTRTKTSIRAYHAVQMELGEVHPSVARSIAGHQVAGDVHGSVYLHSLRFPMEKMQAAVDVVPIPLPS